MKKKINEFQTKINQRLKRLCGRPSPEKRLLVVVLACVVFGVADIWFVVNAISGIGKNDTEKVLIKMQYIEPLQLENKNSIHLLEHQENDDQ
jgi:hypothetical protein